MELSVILPVIDETVSLRKTAQIVLSENGGDICEILIIGCGLTTPEARAVADELVRADSRIKLLFQKRPFLGGAMRDAFEWARRATSHGAGEILLTSMDRDGTKEGFDVELTRTISDAVDVPVIASGGVGTLDHLVEGIVEGGADAVLAASIFHFREHTIAEAKQTLLAAGVTVRPPERRQSE